MAIWRLGLGGLALIIWLSAGALPALAQGTAFSYQGRLNDGPIQASGRYDLRFAIFDRLTNGVQQGPLLTNSATGVSNGLFSVMLDFGNPFSGADRWLELAVRTNGGAAFTTLSPRQPLLPVPYAIYAGNAAVAASAGAVAAANIVGTLATAQLPSVVVTNGEQGLTLTGSFSGTVNATGGQCGDELLVLVPGWRADEPLSHHQFALWLLQHGGEL